LNNSADIYPDNDVEFCIEFILNEEFIEFFINLVIQEPSGVNVAHLRNDYSGILLKDVKKGVYKVSIVINRIPFKSGHYSYCYRLVGKKEDGNLMIKDFTNYSFQIKGDRKQSDLIKHEWKITILEN